MRSGWKVAAFLSADRLATEVLLGALPYLPISLMKPWPELEWLLAVSTLVLTALFLRLEGRPLSSIGLRPDLRWGLEFGAGTLAGILLIVLTALVVRGFGGFHWEGSSGGVASLASGASMYLAVAFREELGFRGYAFQRLVDGLGPWLALSLMSLAFAWIHWGNPGMQGSVMAWATLNIALAGAVLGLAYLKTRSLALPIGLHLGWNWAQGSLLGFGVSGTFAHGFLTPVFHNRPEWLTGGAFGLEASLPCTVVCVLTILALACWKGLDKEGSAQTP